MVKQIGFTQNLCINNPSNHPSFTPFIKQSKPQLEYSSIHWLSIPPSIHLLIIPTSCFFIQPSVNLRIHSCNHSFIHSFRPLLIFHCVCVFSVVQDKTILSAWVESNWTYSLGFHRSEHDWKFQAFYGIQRTFAQMGPLKSLMGQLWNASYWLCALFSGIFVAECACCCVARICRQNDK